MRIFIIFCLLSCHTLVYGQYSTGYKWGLTELDTLVSVRTPFAGEPTEDPAVPGFIMYTAAGHYNRFVALRMDYDIASGKQSSSDGKIDTHIILNADKVFRRIINKEFLQFDKAKLTHEYGLALTATPVMGAMHRVYRGFDTIFQEPADLEVTWFSKNHVVYIFFCTTLEGAKQEANEEKQHYFSTISVRTVR